jgi:hypothetical protein
MDSVLEVKPATVISKITLGDTFNSLRQPRFIPRITKLRPFLAALTVDAYTVSGTVLTICKRELCCAVLCRAVQSNRNDQGPSFRLKC